MRRHRTASIARRVCAAAFCLALLTAAPALAATAGSADLGFGDQGLAKVSLAGSGGANAVAVQSDGKIVVAGQTNWPEGASVFEVARFMPDGTLDAAFGVGGRVSVPVSERALAAGVMVQPDGRLVISGGAQFGEALQFAAVRLMTDGSLDSSFGSGGIVTVPIGTSAMASAAVPAAGGKIILGGSAKVRENVSATTKVAKLAFAAARLNPDGSLDAGYGSGGIATIPAPTATYGIAIQSDGKLVFGGEALSNGARTMAAGRLTATGRPDPSYGKSGVALAPIGQEAFATGLALSPDGSVVLTGSTVANTHVAAAVRLKSTGRTDSSFGRKGVTTVNIGGITNGATRQPDGKTLIASANGMAALRLSSTGVVDTAFGTNGVARVPSVGVAAANGVTMQPDGMIVLGGAVVQSGVGSLAVGRLQSGL